MSLNKVFSTLKAGKGHFGHSGRPGKRGGSLPKGRFAPGSAQDTSIQGEAIRRTNQMQQESSDSNTPERMQKRVTLAQAIQSTTEGRSRNVQFDKGKKGLESEGFKLIKSAGHYSQYDAPEGLSKDDFKTSLTAAGYKRNERDTARHELYFHPDTSLAYRLYNGTGNTSFGVSITKI